MKRNILVLNGSLRTKSSTSILIEQIINLFSDQIIFYVYQDLKEIPSFDDPAHTPESVVRFKDLIQHSDGVLVCTPEYAFGIPGALKNALDWTVSTGEFTDKPVCIITAATSGQKAHAALTDVFTALSAKLYPEANLLIPFIRSHIINGRISDTETVGRIRSVIQIFLQYL